MLIAQYNAAIYGISVTPEITDQWREDHRVLPIRFVHLGTEDLGFREFGFDFSRYGRKRVIWLSRDPRDVCISYYFHVTRRWKPAPAHLSDFSTFLRDPEIGLPRLVGFMNLVERGTRELEHVMKLTYEDLHADANGVLARLLGFVGADSVDAKAIAYAVEQCRFETLRKMEKEAVIQHDALLPGDPADPDSFKVRAGKVGGYREHMSADDLSYVSRYLDEHLEGHKRS
jgi:hypothetical protein